VDRELARRRCARDDGCKGHSGWLPGLGRGVGLLQFIIGPSGDRPLRISLEELSAEDAALQGSKILFLLAKYPKDMAQSLVLPPTPAQTSTPFSDISSKPSPFTLESTSPGSSTTTSHKLVPSLVRPSSPSPAISPAKPTSSNQHTLTTQRATAGIAARKSFEEKVDGEDSDGDLVPEVLTRSAPSPKKKPVQKLATPKRPVSGASLANPNKRARRVVSLEFEDDD
jgi:hypothetical protein